MGRGYWVPPNSKKLPACDGYYVNVNAIAETDIEKRWNTFLEQVSKGLQSKEKSLKIKKDWSVLDEGRGRFIVLFDSFVEVIAEEINDYFAIFVLIPEQCSEKAIAKRDFYRYLSNLRNTLTKLYPSFVYKRKNYRQLINIG